MSDNNKKSSTKGKEPDSTKVKLRKVMRSGDPGLLTKKTAEAANKAKNDTIK